MHRMHSIQFYLTRTYLIFVANLLTRFWTGPLWQETQFKLELAKEGQYYWHIYVGSLRSGPDFRYSWIQELKRLSLEHANMLSASLHLSISWFYYTLLSFYWAHSLECSIYSDALDLCHLYNLSFQRIEPLSSDSFKKLPWEDSDWGRLGHFLILEPISAPRRWDMLWLVKLEACAPASGNGGQRSGPSVSHGMSFLPEREVLLSGKGWMESLLCTPTFGL